MKPLVDAGKLRATTDFSAVAELDTINICVPTPLRKTKDPDMSYIVSSCQEIAKHFHPGMLVILESTTYPGTTDELMLPMFEQAGSEGRRGLFPVLLAGARRSGQSQISRPRTSPKWSAESPPPAPRLGALFYGQALETVVPVGSTRVAEMVKLLENTFRMINIGLVNEIALMCDRMGINVWEVIDAAATKPFGFMPFYPGPGLGGHCIPIDPFYLSWKTKQAGIEARFIELAGYINGQMPHFVVDKIQNALNDHSKPLKGSRVHVLGVAYKRDIDDVRESPALDIIHLLGKARRQGELQRSVRSQASRRRSGSARHGGDRRRKSRRGSRLRGDRDGSQGIRLCSHRREGAPDRRYAQRAEGKQVSQDRPVVTGLFSEVGFVVDDGHLLLEIR